MSKWSLNAKIYSVIAIFVLASFVISFVGLTKMSDINDALSKIVTKDADRIRLAQQMKDLFSSQIIDEKNFILEDHKDRLEKIKDRTVTRNESLLKTWEEFNDKVATEAGKKNLRDFKDVYSKWWLQTQEIQKMSLAGENKAAAQVSVTKGLALRLQGEEMISALIVRNQKFMNDSAEMSAVNYAHARTLMLTISLMAIMAGLMTAYFILKSLSRSIDEVISNLTDNSNQVTSAAHQIASSSEELSQASTEQASALEETSSSIEELNSMVQKNADNAKKTFSIAGSSKDSAGKGKVVVSEMINAIHEINVSNAAIMDSINDSNKKISEIVDVISEIGNKTKVINDIVFQTKLLSFNASVEAARAGDNGRGFAVVAEEVGNLAQMSGNAAKEISEMLDGSILKVQGIVSETKTKVEHLILDGKNKVQAGTRIAEQCGAMLDEIVGNITTVTEMADEISVACTEQAQGVQEITRAMGQLDQVTQINAATSQETAGAAEELSAQAQSLRQVVGVLVQTIKGSDGASDIKSHTRLPQTIGKPMAASAKILPMKKNPGAKTKGSVAIKKAVGEGFVPAESDPRFEEV